MIPRDGASITLNALAAVMKDWRRQGIGSAMLQKVLEEMTNRGMYKATLNAQVTAVSFYQRFGLQLSGDEFMDAGIPHIKMFLQL